MRQLMTAVLLALVVLLAGSSATVPAAPVPVLTAKLLGFEEVPAISTVATGRFRARLGETTIDFELRYEGLESAVQQAHIHFGQTSVNGGVSVFLCSNLLAPPPGTPPCPTPSGSVRGTRSATDVIGPAGQGIAAGEFAELRRAMLAGVTYVNVHTLVFPGGEIRGQVHEIGR